MPADPNPEQQQLVAELLSSGKYESEEAVLDEALQFLYQRDKLQGMLQDGIRQLDAGEQIPADDVIRQLRSTL